MPTESLITFSPFSQAVMDSLNEGHMRVSALYPDLKIKCGTRGRFTAQNLSVPTPFPARQKRYH